MSAQDKLKQQAAEAALEQARGVSILGVGTGSTVNFFIDALVKIKHQLDAVVASSVATETRLRAVGITPVDLNQVGDVPVYVDGADEFTAHRTLIKGGGGALTREKILAAASKKFICIADASKRVNYLGKFPLAVEVIPMARGYVARELIKLGGQPEYREGFVTDNGNIILDVHNLKLQDPLAIESLINNITGVVCHGLFAKRGADCILVATADGVAIVD